MAEAEQPWLPVIARALAYLCLKSGAQENRSMQQNAKLLEGLGLSRADAAAVLGTTPSSIAELHRQARQKKGGKRGSAKPKKTGRR